MIILFNKKISTECINKNIENICGLNFKSFDFGDGHKGIQIFDDIEEEWILQNISSVEKILNINKSYKFVSREFKSNNTVIDVDGVKIGDYNFQLIGGPCSFEGQEMFRDIVYNLKGLGVKIIRGGAFKPRTSPYFFQGIGEEALRKMRDITSEFGVKLVSEIVSTDYINLFEEYVDIIQVGTRNMQNYELLKKLGKTNKPILLKRGLCATVEEFLLSAEYIVSNGNMNVILCERGIRTFERSTRNTLDISAVPIVKKLSHLPIIVDPSHASGQFDLVEPLALASVASGCHGIMVEVHNDPINALSDGTQSIKFDRFNDMSEKILKIRSVLF